MSETASERFYRQLEALKKRDFDEVKKISKEITIELAIKRENEINNGRQEKFVGIK